MATVLGCRHGKEGNPRQQRPVRAGAALPRNSPPPPRATEVSWASSGVHDSIDGKWGCPGQRGLGTKEPSERSPVSCHLGSHPQHCPRGIGAVRALCSGVPAPLLDSLPSAETCGVPSRAAPHVAPAWLCPLIGCWGLRSRDSGSPLRGGLGEEPTAGRPWGGARPESTWGTEGEL